MSTIWFHSREKTVGVRGSERAHMGVVSSKIALSFLMVHFEPDPIMELLPENHYLRGDVRMGNLKSAFASWYSASAGVGFTLPDGRKVSPFEISLNTLLSVGNDPLRLLARLHGQVEIHGYVEEENREWFARLIVEAREKKLLRSDMGWEQVSELFITGPEGPIVTSYSVCDYFPNPYFTGNSWEEWDEVPEEKRWETAFSGLRDSRPSMEFTPEEWKDFRFGEGLTAMDIREIADNL